MRRSISPTENRDMGAAANLEMVRDAILESPLGRLLGIEVESVERDRVRIRLPFRAEVTTVGDIVHGGALSTVADAAATAAAWSGADLSTNPRGTTIALTSNFLAAARGEDVVADARVVQRGRTITVCEVTVEGANGKRVASALVTYKLG
jgi:uncharacterized protein (TIGR00369 family)